MLGAGFMMHFKLIYKQYAINYLNTLTATDDMLYLTLPYHKRLALLSATFSQPTGAAIL